jgi:hypothetical protein
MCLAFFFCWFVAIVFIHVATDSCLFVRAIRAKISTGASLEQAGTGIKSFFFLNLKDYFSRSKYLNIYIGL